MGRSSRPSSARVGGPGPADYTYASASPRAGAGPFARAPRSPGGEGADTPGPAAYDSTTSATFLRPQSARAVIGSASRMSLRASPASAEVPLYAPAFDAVLAVSPRQPIARAPRFAPGANEGVPGPGAIELPPTPTGPAFTIRAR